MKKFILFLIVTLCCTDEMFAQDAVRGCLVGNVLYTEPSGRGNDYFLRTPGNQTSTCGFKRVGNTSNCRLYNSGDKSVESSYTLYPDAASNGWIEIANCPVDGDAWALFVPVSLLSAVSIARRGSHPTKNLTGKTL
ncbi:hypothetical protein EV200_104496 [Pedobacter psychrotolerans]|uniref:Uncharacterized protein n=1 Tax=Pedobacter psychrotolerans TaxID=1843235 RepID=A0A4R2HCG2_9SPHI|nr:hypothetical protein [Pedobacter psychrotolerans]TCO25458.1 hypothetical protein EV200_104496 [Pedobacter psychrotolerans]GGE45283.1 hypothetical protein GCM10011413_09280 [Pedobacter psychrotolerans]